MLVLSDEKHEEREHQGTQMTVSGSCKPSHPEIMRQALVRGSATVLQVHTDQAAEFEEKPSRFVAI